MRGRPLTALSNEELFSELKRLVLSERRCTVEVLRHLAEIDRRRALEATATPSLYVYCVRELGYSEGAAYRRIHAARCARDFPRIYVLLRRGQITLTTVSLLAPHLCRDNYRQLLGQACGKTRYEVERLIATLEPQRERRELIRPLGTPTSTPADGNCGETLPMSWGGSASSAASLQDSAGPLKSEIPSDDSKAPSRRVEFRFTADEDFLSKLRRAREVLWHKHPRGRLEEILNEAIEALLEKRDPERHLARKARRRASLEAAG